MKRPEGRQSATPHIDEAIENRMETESHLMDAGRDILVAEVGRLEAGIYLRQARSHLREAYLCLVRQQRLDEAAKREVLERQAASGRSAA